MGKATLKEDIGEVWRKILAPSCYGNKLRILFFCRVKVESGEEFDCPLFKSCIRKCFRKKDAEVIIQEMEMMMIENEKDY